MESQLSICSMNDVTNIVMGIYHKCYHISTLYKCHFCLFVCLSRSHQSVSWIPKRIMDTKPYHGYQSVSWIPKCIIDTKAHRKFNFTQERCFQIFNFLNSFRVISKIRLKKVFFSLDCHLLIFDQIDLKNENFFLLI